MRYETYRSIPDLTQKSLFTILNPKQCLSQIRFRNPSLRLRMPPVVKFIITMMKRFIQ